MTVTPTKNTEISPAESLITARLLKWGSAYGHSARNPFLIGQTADHFTYPTVHYRLKKELEKLEQGLSAMVLEERNYGNDGSPLFPANSQPLTPSSTQSNPSQHHY